VKAGWFVAALAGCAGVRVTRDAQQLVVVVTDSWTAARGQLRRYERNAGGWRAVGATIAVVVGNRGLGWGAGTHPASARAADEPEKREGDGRAPAGAFRLREATGYPKVPPAGTSLNYRQATAALACIDEPNAQDYNQLVGLVDGGSVSHEPMRRADELYFYTIVVEHNRAPVVAGRGSCIFLHRWSAPDAPTVGCTAMAATDLEALLVWLRADANPLYVALPRAVYERVARSWGLPALAP
jgi:L,D-peptidoglycan transpeptidase YkuD (ErfK/YbiS/YcfS/YnhG family)